MSAVSTDVAATIEGERRAQAFLGLLRHVAGDGNELHRVITAVPADERRGFCRVLQKALERQAFADRS